MKLCCASDCQLRRQAVESSLLQREETLLTGLLGRSFTDEVLSDTCYSSAADLLEDTPGLTAKLEEAREGLATQGLRLSEGATLADALRQVYTQKLLTAQVQKKRYVSLLATLNTEQAAETRGGGGP